MKFSIKIINEKKNALSLRDTFVLRDVIILHYLRLSLARCNND